MDHLRALVLDPTHPIPDWSLNLPFNGIRFIPCYSLPSLHLTIRESPRLSRCCRRAMTQPSHPKWYRRRFELTRRVHLVRVEVLPAHNLQPPFAAAVPETWSGFFHKPPERGQEIEKYQHNWGKGLWLELSSISRWSNEVGVVVYVGVCKVHLRLARGKLKY